MERNINYDEIDVEMKEIIRVLNEKGWRTVACCQGHYDDKFKHAFICGYIYFAKSVPLEYRTIKIGSCVDIPKDKYASQMRVAYKYWNRSGYGIYWEGTSYKRVSIEDKQKEHDEIINDLLKWAKELPNRNDI